MILAPSLLLAALAWSQQELPDPKPVFSPAEIEAARKDPKSFEVADEAMGIEWRGFAVRPREVPPPPGGGELDEAGIMLDQIINIGRKIWKIIEENKPVVDIKTQYAAAVPEGIKHWSQLSGWDTPAGTIYGFTAKNGYGMNVVDVRYQVLRTTGGAFKGKGRYLTGVTVEPLLVSVAWGYKVTITAEAPSVTNADKTGENPTAGMMLNLKWRIQTPVKDVQGTGVYYVRGDGLFVEVGGPFVKKEVRQASSLVERVAAKILPAAGRRVW